MSQYDPLEEMLTREGGIVRILNFLPGWVAQEMLRILQMLPQQQWEVQQNSCEQETVHRFHVAQPAPAVAATLGEEGP